jgi:phage baseplate assembly protein V
MNKVVKKMMAPLARRISLMLGRALLTAVSDANQRQLVQLAALAGEVKSDVERVQEYGFTSHPLPGAQVLFVSMGGNRDHPVAISVDDPRYRVKDLSAGEVAIYTDEGDKIVLKRGNTVEITTQTLLVKAATKVRCETPLLECTGEIHDRCDVQENTMSGMRNIYNTHTHPENNTGNTNQPNQQMGGA